MKSYEFISQHRMLIDHFGQWPDFHDAEVHSLTLHRPDLTTTDKLIPTLELKLRGWILKNDVATAGVCMLYGDAVWSYPVSTDS